MLNFRYKHLTVSEGCTDVGLDGFRDGKLRISWKGGMLDRKRDAVP